MRGEPGPVTYEVLRFPKDVSRWNYVYDLLRLRKTAFIDRLRWPLHAQDGVEFEQYDHFEAVYIVAVLAGQVVGGARLLRTDRKCRSAHGEPLYSYMIRDAARGLLDGLRIELDGGEAPTDPRIWEITRLVSQGGSLVGKGLIQAARTFLQSQHATECLFLGPPAFMRLARIMGGEIQPLGPIVSDATGSFLPFSCRIEPAVGTTTPAINIGRARFLHLDGDNILGTTYEWVLTGEVMTIWHEKPDGRRLKIIPADWAERPSAAVQDVMQQE